MPGPGSPAAILEKAGELNTLGQYESAQALMRFFFVDGDFSRPLILERIPSDSGAKYSVLNESAIAHVGIGRPAAAIPLYEANLADCWNEAQLAGARGDHEEQADQLAGVRAQNQNLAEAFFRLGDFAKMERAARQAHDLSEQAKDPANQRDSLILLGTAQLLAKKEEEAKLSFGRADTLAREIGLATDIWGLMRAEARLASAAPKAGSISEIQRNALVKANEQVEFVLGDDPPPQVRAQALKIRGDIARALGE